MAKTIRSSRYQRFIELMVEARLNAGLTQVVLAGRVGRPQSFVAKYEKGERRLDIVEFVELVEAMGAEPKEVFSDLMDTQLSRNVARSSSKDAPPLYRRVAGARFKK